MNKTVILGAILAFAIPVVVIFFMKGDSFSTLTPANSNKSKSSGTLLYFYSPS